MQKVTCPVCNHKQVDGGKRNACPRCGMEPVPSYAYPKGSAFYPKPTDGNEDNATVDGLYKQLRKKRAARGTR